MGRAEREGGMLAPKGLAAFEERAGAAGGKQGGAASVNVLSLGFAATAILLSLFLLMALFERFLRPSSTTTPSSSSSSSSAYATAPAATSEKFHAPPLPPCDPFAGVSVLMPGHSFPTFIANPLNPLPLLPPPPPTPDQFAPMAPPKLPS